MDLGVFFVSPLTDPISGVPIASQLGTQPFGFAAQAPPAAHIVPCPAPATCTAVP